MEGSFVQEQDHVSATNDEPPTAGYGLLNLSGEWSPSQSRTLRLSVNNVLDKTYRRHLDGFNRVQDSDVPTGRRSDARLPGNERNLVLNFVQRW